MVIETFATLRIFSDSIHPSEIGAKLGISATGGYERDPEARSKPKRETNHWSWTTREKLNSEENHVHLKAIISQFLPKSVQLKELRDIGCKMDVCNYMVTTGQGGPVLETEIIDALSTMGLAIWWDIYFGEVGET